MRLVIVRHGETEENLKKIIQGHSHGKLTETGIKQAKKLAKRLKNEKFDIIFSSDLARAFYTAREIRKYHKNVHAVYTNLLRERNCGALQGKLYKPYIDKRKIFKKYKVESNTKLKNRAKKFYKELLKDYINKNILVISHGGFIKSLLSVIMKIPVKKAFEILHQENACVNIIEVDEKGNHKVHLINCIKHL